MEQLYQAIAATLILLPILCTPADSLSCKDAVGEDTDWFAGYKLPKQSHAESPLLKQGMGYTVFGVGSVGWSEIMNISVGAGHPLAETLKGAYISKNDADNFNLFYNDEQPAGPKSFDLGHTKSVLAFDATSGFWLLHSVPKFPPAISYAYPHSGLHYGQSMLCVTFKTEQLSNISKQLFYSQPFIYASQLPAKFESQFPTLYAVIRQNSTAEHGPFIRSTGLTSLGGLSFTHFSKSGKWGKDLYTDGIAKQLNSDLLVETWRNGPGDMPSSSCQAPFPKVLNAEDIKLDIPDSKPVQFKTSLDHSKFAVSRSTSCDRNLLATSSDDAIWTCIGDINRQHGQLVRGGGSMCSSNPAIWQVYGKLVDKFEHCSTAYQSEDLGGIMS